LHSACSPSSPGACDAGDEEAEDADISSLLGMLASVTDPRSPQGIQHILEFVLAVCVVALLAGAKNYREIAGHAADIPQPLLRKLGAEWSWFRLRYKYPSESTIRNVLTRVDAAELDLVTARGFSRGPGNAGKPSGKSRSTERQCAAPGLTRTTRSRCSPRCFTARLSR